MLKRKIIFIVLILVLSSVIMIKMLFGFIPVPIGIRHFVHMIFPPKDLYKPIVSDRFDFHKVGFSRFYHLKPKYYDIYVIGIKITNGIESKYKFTGKIRIEFFHKNRLLFEKIITSLDHAGYLKKDLSKFSTVGLTLFEIPLKNKYASDIGIKITVLEPDMELYKMSDRINIYIAVSGIP